MNNRAIAALCTAVSVSISFRLGAQAPPGSDTLSRRAVAESAVVLAGLRAATKAHPADAGGWFHRGMVAFALSARADTTPLGADYTPMRTDALDSFQRAVSLDANNPQHWLWLGRLRNTGKSDAERSGAPVLFTRALALLRGSSDKTNVLDLLVMLSNTEFNFYDLFSTYALGHMSEPTLRGLEVAIAPKADTPLPETSRGLPSGGTKTVGPASAMPMGPGSGSSGGPSSRMTAGSLNPPEIDSLTSVSQAARNDLAYGLPRILGRATNQVLEVYGMPGSFEDRGEDHYLRAKQGFEEAFTLAPADARVFRGLAKVHVAIDAWHDLQAVAEDRVRRMPADPWGWMALGLAHQRLKASADAVVAFDSGLARMTPELRQHIDRLDRVLRRRDSLAYVHSDSAARAKESAFAFLLAQPLWSTGVDKPRTEFLARIAFAEFRWASMWSSTLGADTPKGQLYVRYGPPDMQQDRFWLYNSGLAFAFAARGRNAIAFGDSVLDARIEEWQPARWDNIAETKIDSMPIQVARFRAAPDSVDVYLATRAPMQALDTVTMINTRSFANFWLSGLATPDAYRDSLALSGDGRMNWTRRLPVGPYYYRVEAVVPGALQAARAAASMLMGNDTTTGFSMRGFAMSDLIMASRAEPRGTPQRWSDIDVTPVLAPVVRNAELSLVWETYEVGRTGTSARYQVVIRLLRQTPAPTFGRKIGAQIIRGFTGSTGVSRKEAAEGVTFTFERDVPYAPQLVDNVTLSLGGTPAGDYVVRLDITDHVTGRTTSRATGIVVHE